MISATIVQPRCQDVLRVVVGDIIPNQRGVGCGQRADGMYSFPTEHPHIPHFPVPKNASGFQYSHERQNISLDWNVSWSAFLKSSCFHATNEPTKFLAFSGNFASGMVVSMILIGDGEQSEKLPLSEIVYAFRP